MMMYRGNRVTVLNEIPVGNDLMSHVKFEDGTELIVKSRQLYKQQFSIGDKVRSLGTFEGTVVAFEEGNIVCKSDKGKDDRLRYSYKDDEIVHTHQYTKLSLGEKYIVNGSSTVLVMESTQSGMAVLYNPSGTIYAVLIPVVCSVSDLKKHNIHTIERVN